MNREIKHQIVIPESFSRYEKRFWRNWRRATFCKRYTPAWFFGWFVSNVMMHLACADIPFTKTIQPFSMPHGLNGILISYKAHIGDGCVLFHQVTIGSNTLLDSKGFGAPVIGSNVYIGAGAKIIGEVGIGDRVRVGSNCVVVKDVPTDSTVVLAGGVRIIPAGPQRDNSFTSIINIEA